MFYRKLISALVFAAFSFYFTEAARAQCDNPEFCFDFGIPVTVDNFTGSSVSCDLNSGNGSQPFNTLDIGSGLGTSTATFTQTGTAKCKHLPDNADLGTCGFELTWTNVTTSLCMADNKTFTVTGSCTPGSPLGVTGTIKCASGVVNLGIGGFGGTFPDTCAGVFPAHGGLAAGQVLDFTVKTTGVPVKCEGPFVQISHVKEQYCNSGEPSPTPGAPDCTPILPPTPTNTRTTNPDTTDLTPVVTFDFNVRQTVNVKPCRPNDRGNATIDILGSAKFGVENIDPDTLLCEGAPLFDCKTGDVNFDGFPDSSCKVNTCPTFGPALGELDQTKNPDGTVTVTATCTGELQSGTAILGTDDRVLISPTK